MARSCLEAPCISRASFLQFHSSCPLLCVLTAGGRASLALRRWSFVVVFAGAHHRLIFSMRFMGILSLKALRGLSHSGTTCRWRSHNVAHECDVGGKVVNPVVEAVSRRGPPCETAGPVVRRSALAVVALSPRGVNDTPRSTSP